jgi:GCK domain
VIGLYLKPQSKDILNRRLKAIDVRIASSNLVVINGAPKKEDAFVFEPLYGERAAFRLVEIVSENGRLKGIGRVSTMMGPVDAGALPYLIIGESLKDIAPIKIEPNLVLEGRICSSLFVEDECNCSFDRSSIETTSRIASTSPKPMESSSSSESKVDTKDDPECPICRYMKGGPCAASFEAWQGCMETAEKNKADFAKCSDATGAMTECMLQHEYYDVFVAGMSEKLEYVSEQKKSIAKA